MGFLTCVRAVQTAGGIYTIPMNLPAAALVTIGISDSLGNQMGSRAASYINTRTSNGFFVPYECPGDPQCPPGNERKLYNVISPIQINVVNAVPFAPFSEASDGAEHHPKHPTPKMKNSQKCQRNHKRFHQCT
jgi:hypothetical protein